MRPETNLPDTPLPTMKKLSTVRMLAPLASEDLSKVEDFVQNIKQDIGFKGIIEIIYHKELKPEVYRQLNKLESRTVKLISDSDFYQQRENFKQIEVLFVFPLPLRFTNQASLATYVDPLLFRANSRSNVADTFSAFTPYPSINLDSYQRFSISADPVIENTPYHIDTYSTTEKSPLIKALLNGNFEKIKSLLNQGAPTSIYIPKHGNPALQAFNFFSYDGKENKPFSSSENFTLLNLKKFIKTYDLVTKWDIKSDLPLVRAVSQRNSRGEEYIQFCEMAAFLGLTEKASLAIKSSNRSAANSDCLNAAIKGAIAGKHPDLLLKIGATLDYSHLISATKVDDVASFKKLTHLIENNSNCDASLSVPDFRKQFAKRLLDPRTKNLFSWAASQPEYKNIFTVEHFDLAINQNESDLAFKLLANIGPANISSTLALYTALRSGRSSLVKRILKSGINLEAMTTPLKEKIAPSNKLIAHFELTKHHDIRLLYAMENQTAFKALIDELTPMQCYELISATPAEAFAQHAYEYNWSTNSLCDIGKKCDIAMQTCQTENENSIKSSDFTNTFTNSFTSAFLSLFTFSASCDVLIKAGYNEKQANHLLSAMLTIPSLYDFMMSGSFPLTAVISFVKIIADNIMEKYDLKASLPESLTTSKGTMLASSFLLNFISQCVKYPPTNLSNLSSAISGTFGNFLGLVAGNASGTFLAQTKYGDTAAKQITQVSFWIKSQIIPEGSPLLPTFKHTKFN